MGLIADFFSSFSRSGAQVTADIQSVAQRGRVVRRAPTVRPRTRRAGIHRIKRRVVTAVSKLSRTRQVRFINTEARRIDTAIKRETKARIPTLRDIQMAGYKYGKKNPEAARLIYGSGNFGAGVVRKAIPKDIGVPVGQAMHAFSDGAIKGVRNEPVKTLAFLALPGAVGAVMKGAKYIPIASKIVKSEKAMKAAAYGFDIVYSHNVYTRVNAPVVDFYKDGKVLSETSKKMPDGSIQITQQIEQVPVMRKPNTNEKSERLGIIFSTEAGPMVFGAMGIQKVSKVRFKELGRKGVKTSKTTIRKLKKGTKEFIKAEKAEVQLAKKKKKKKQVQKLVQVPKPKPREIRVSELRGLVKPKIVQTIDLSKDLKAIAQLKAAQSAIKTAPKAKANIFLNKKALTRAKVEANILSQYSLSGRKRIRTLEDKIYSMKTSIEMKTEFGQDVKFLQKQLLKLELKLLAEQTKAKVVYFQKLNSDIISFLRVETKSPLKSIQKELAILKTKAKQVTTVKQKAVLLSKVKAILKTLTKQRTLLIAYSKSVQDAKYRQQIIIITKLIEEQISKTKTIQKVITGTKIIYKPITITKKVPKKPPKKIIRRPPKKPPKKPPTKPPKKVIEPPVIPVPKLLIPTKTPVKKKKKRKKKGVKEAFVKNPVPSLKAFLG